MSNRVVYFNGQFVPERDARVSIFDSALVFGDMAFESTRTFGGRPFHLRDHLERLFATLSAIETDCRLSIDEMERITLEALARNAPTESAEMEWQIVHNISRGPLARLSRGVCRGAAADGAGFVLAAGGSARELRAELRERRTPRHSRAAAYSGVVVQSSSEDSQPRTLSTGDATGEPHSTGKLAGAC